MNEHHLENSIAIVGMSGRFPGADDIQTFWENLCDGEETISTFSNKELRDAGLSEDRANSPNYVKSRGILKGIEFFDDNFFGFTPKEAQITDPQHRLFLECAWEALENAGYCSETYQGSVGVYGGSGASSYYLNNIHPNHELSENLGNFLLRIGNDKDFLTTRVSYKLNLKGPSITLQTACSTSLVSVCMACNQLLSYECDMALAGGVSISVPQTSGYVYKEGMILSKDGKCRPFDAKAQGTVMSDGVGVVVLKRLQDALKDNDHIYSVIRGYGTNNDGFRKMSYSAPSSDGQSEAISSAISMADIGPETIGYLEAHGTGTLLGDPVEVLGLTNSFNTSKKQYCPIGSVKGNIGHTSEAAGVIGLIKTALTLYHQKIPPSLHFNKPNPHIDFSDSPFHVNTTLKDWEPAEHPRRAGISSFGIGGTNAHAILEEWTQENTASEEPLSTYPLILSAKTLTALKTMATNLGKHLKGQPKLSLADVAYTLYIGRKTFEHKRVLICNNREEAIEQLLSFDPDNFSNEPEIVDENIFEEKEYHRVPLPTYPFEKKYLWIDPPTTEKKSTFTHTKNQPIESTVKDVWIDFLGTRSIDIHDDFFDLGGDSLLAIEVASKLSTLFNIDLGMQTLLSHSTIAKLTQVISGQRATSSPLIELKTGNSSPPVFLVHPIEGNLFCFRDLVTQLKCSNSIYGIQSIDHTIESIEELATFYINELRKVQTTGPYHLLGASFGGIVAYEMARQLEAAGDSIALLCMLDSGTPDSSFYNLPTDEARVASLIQFLSREQVLPSELTTEKVMTTLGLEKIPAKEQQVILDRIKKHLKMLMNYKPKIYDGRIYFFQSSDQGHEDNPVGFGKSWSKLVDNKIDIYEARGNHLSILFQPNVDQLANFIREKIKKEEES